jgi:thymidylate kinase
VSLAPAAWMTYRTVVLEGCNGAGKTTFAAHLARQGFVVIHSSSTPEGVDLVERYHGILARPDPIVLDRSFISELVYGPMYRGHSRLSIEQCLCLAGAVAARSGVVVHLRVPAAHAHSRLQARGAEPVPSITELEEIIRRYNEVLATLTGRIPVLGFDAIR